MKKAVGILLFFITIFGLFGCSNEVVKQQEIEAFVNEYKAKLYTIDDPLNPPTFLEIADDVKPYLTEDEFEKLMANRIIGMASSTAKSLNKSIVIEDVIFEEVNENEDGTFDCDITLKIKLYDKKSSEIIEKKGQLTISNKSNDGLKISRDWEERIKIGEAGL